MPHITYASSLIYEMQPYNPEMQPNNLFETKTVFKVFFVAHRSQFQGDLEAIPLYQTLRRLDELHRLSSLAETNRFDLCLFPNYLNYRRNS